MPNAPARKLEQVEEIIQIVELSAGEVETLNLVSA